MRDLINKPKYIFIAYIFIVEIFAFVYWLLPIYTFEKELSFPQSLYLSVVTITTLGYGDITPKDNYGMFIVSVEAILGILIIGFFINSVWKIQLDRIEKDQQEKIKESVQELNRNKLVSYHPYLNSIFSEYKRATLDVTTPIGSRRLKNTFDYNFKFSDLQNIFGPSLLIKYTFDKSVIEIYFDIEQELATELKYILANFSLENIPELRNQIINFLNASYSYNLKDILCSYSKYPQNDFRRTSLEDMIKRFDELPPNEYHQSNTLTPVIFLYQSLPVKMKILETIENEFEKIIKKT